MRERPIIFSAPMVRALLAGTKTQTRRALRDQNPVDLGAFANGAHLSRRPVFDRVANAAIGHRLAPVSCPYGSPGDRLWVRETFYAWGRWETRFSAKKGRDEWHFVDLTVDSGKRYRYAADRSSYGPRERGGVAPQWWKRPAIHMPRGASRITLELVRVRVERLADITRDDAEAEGIGLQQVSENDHRWIDYTDRLGFRTFGDPRRSFRSLWESINGTDSWSANPFVWIVEFRNETTS